MKDSIQKKLDELNGYIKAYSELGKEVPADILQERELLLEKNNLLENLNKSDTPIFDTLVAYYPYGAMPEEKMKCIKDTVEQLLQDGERANEPGLLLGKIQCGKTDTFEDIIGLAFDKGIDIAIILTKGTKPLAKQTLMRLKKDYKHFKPSDDANQSASIEIYDIMNIWKTLTQANVDRSKIVFVCKKQATNLDHLIEMFSTKFPYLQKKKVLIVDDEADFASRNYRSVKKLVNDDSGCGKIKTKIETEMAKISQQIDDFRRIPEYCRYLQVTATPYCLYLQPQGELNLNGDDDMERYAMPFRPRFTTIVPIHDKYIGGKQYFEDSRNAESMYSHLYHQIEQKCIDVLGHEDKRYLNNSVSSANIYGLTYAIVSYFMATAIRRIQKRAEGKIYKSSALIHVEIDKKNHDWQSRVIKRLIKSIKDTILEDDQSDQRIWAAIESNYKDFKESNEKGRKEGLIEVGLPSKDVIIDDIKEIFTKNEYNIRVVNSDEQVESLLDEESGELKRETAANIFIGGNILDRGITIKNMLCFFYGRNPKKFQQDTVLQHARMYGARDKEDMAVTRLHTTSNIYDVFTRMNALDNVLRDWFLEGKDGDSVNAIFVGYDKDIKPCATQKIKVSNIRTITPQQRVVPIGFWTGNRATINSIIEKIDSIIENHKNFNQQDENGFFVMEYDTIKEILELISSTYVYKDSDQIHNLDRKNDITDMMCKLKYCADYSNGKVYVMQRTNRDMSRLRANGGYIDAPDTGHTDTAPSRTKAVDAPVVMLLRQNGEKKFSETNENIGWNNAPFYWPVLITQQNIAPTMFALGLTPQKNDVTEESDILDGINPEDVIKLTYSGDLVSHFGEEGASYSLEDCPIETRTIKETTASLYLEKDEDGNYALRPGVSFNNDHGIYSLNNEVFPFVFRNYKYMLLRNGRDQNADEMLLELFPTDCWSTAYAGVNENGDLVDDATDKILVHGTDTIISKDLSEKEFSDKTLALWIVEYPICKVLKFRQSEKHKRLAQKANAIINSDNKFKVQSDVDERTNDREFDNMDKIVSIKCRENHLDLVVNGEIYIEELRINKSNMKKLVMFDANKNAMRDYSGEYIPVKLDAVKLYSSKHCYAIFQVKKIAVCNTSIYYTLGEMLKDNTDVSD